MNAKLSEDSGLFHARTTIEEYEDFKLSLKEQEEFTTKRLSRPARNTLCLTQFLSNYRTVGNNVALAVSYSRADGLRALDHHKLYERLGILLPNLVRRTHDVYHMLPLAVQRSVFILGNLAFPILHNISSFRHYPVDMFRDLHTLIVHFNAEYIGRLGMCVALAETCSLERLQIERDVYVDDPNVDSDGTGRAVFLRKLRDLEGLVLRRYSALRRLTLTIVAGDGPWLRASLNGIQVPDDRVQIIIRRPLKKAMAYGRGMIKRYGGGML